MNILIVSSFLPHPLFSGGHVRLYNIIKRLSDAHTLFLVCEKRDYQTQADINELKKYCKEVITVKRKKQWSAQNILAAGFSKNPFLIVGHTNIEMKDAIIKLLDNNPIDVIHAETFYIMQNIISTTLPIVLVEHNIEHLVYKRFLENSPRVFRPLLSLDIQKLKKAEELFWNRASRLVAVSDEEKKLMKHATEIAVVPNGVDVKRFKMKELRFKKDDKKILFIGDFKWMQNRHAAEWLLKEIWPKFRSEFKVQGSRLWIVGREIPESIKKLTNDPRVVFDENAPRETSHIFEQADIVVSPVKVGGGTSFKILEAMASGVPVVTTELGIEGVKAEDKKEYLKANSTEEFIETINKLLEDEDLYRKIAQNARRLIEEKYDWDIIVPELEKVYKEIVHT